MAPIEKKRLRVREAHQEPRKKRRTGGEKETKIDTTYSVDALPWNEVALPHKLDDAEGFFGLEEISDVEIVRESKAGKVEYKVRKESNEFTKRPTTSTEDAEEWEGFGDSEVERHIATGKSNDVGDAKNSVPRAGNNKDKKRKEHNSLKSSKREANLSGGNQFEGLDEDEEDSGEDDADVSAWQSLNLSEETLASLARLNFSNPTPIQQSAIPDIMEGHDVIGKASTGSGKTLAFGIPVYEHFLRTKDHGGRNGASSDTNPLIALVISPTRELAHQLSTHFADLCSSPGSPSMSMATLTGGLSVHKQRRLLSHANIVIGTPGRLWEMVGEDKNFAEKLRSVRFLVLDEADRLLSEGHFKEVEEILNALDRESENRENRSDNASAKASLRGQRQTLVFSATFQKNLQQKLSGKSKSPGSELMGKNASMEYLLKKLNFREEKPKLIDVNPVSQMATNLKESIVECAGLEKDLYLYTLLLHHLPARTLIFTNSITSVRRLSSLLQNLSLAPNSLHSQMPQKARLRSIERFSAPFSPSQSQILVSTDVAARGLDIPNVDLILHYHLPRAADTYVHRSGRTARASSSGSSILLCAPEEVQGVRRLIAKVHARGSTGDGNKRNAFMRTLDLDRRIVARLKPRVTLAKKIADAALAKEKLRHEDVWLKSAAEDLGVEYDGEEFAAEGGSKKGRGQGRVKKEREAGGTSRAEVGGLRAELRRELGRRVNVGVSERYLSAGGVDVEGLLEGGKGEFLGRVEVEGLG